jgi:signal transduction histidine kinase
MTRLPNILLVDDLPENLVALSALLRRDDAVVLSAASGREALELLLAHDVALAIVDVQMPEMDGFELAELMRGSSRTREVPVIFVTAGMHDQRRIFEGYQSGAVDFLYKPLEPVILRSKVEVFLQLWRQKRQLSEQLEELARAERELREADRRKDEFLGLLSHELRNPLTPIKSSLYILQRAAPGSDQARRAQEVIERQVTHLTRLVDDLLDVTRITRGKVQLQLERVDLVELVRRTADDHRPAYGTAGLELAVATPDAPLLTDADPIRMAQAVGNLLGNALKFTPRGGRVEVSLTAADAAARITVRDTGLGISPEIRAHIFEPFTQADRTLDRSRGGLGLGLALVKSMVELHGGQVEVESDGPGTGAMFTLRLPLRYGAAGREPGTPAPQGERRRRRVLVVEDNPDSAEALREALELMGHEVHLGRSGPEGVAVAERVRPEIVVCDIGLPGIDGYEVARRLRRLVPEAVLVALSGYAQPEDRRRAADAGFARHLAKPPRLEELDRLLAGIERGRDPSPPLGR